MTDMTQATTGFDEAALEAGRQALLQGWSAGGERDIMLARASGALVWDSEGREYIDCTAQAWSNNVGANHPRVIQAATEQLGVLSHARTNYETLPLLNLTRRMAEIAPAGLDRVGVTLHGSVANEMAFKLALRNTDHPGPILSFMDGYHGRSLTTMAASWPHTHTDYLRLFPPFVRVPNPRPYRPSLGATPIEDAERCAELLRQTIRRGTQGKPPALIMEVVLGNGGQHDYPLEFYSWVREICDEEDVLLIVDEIQTGAGRCGDMWASDLYGLRPDLLVWGKGFGGGLPLAGVLVREGLNGFAPGDDSLTFGYFPPALAAGVATIDVLIEEGLIDNARELGRHATERLLEMQERHPLIGDVRGPGLNIGVELVLDRATKEPARAEASRIYKRAQERGLLLGTTRYAGLGNVMKIKPPLCITREQLDTALDIFEQVLAEVE
jgi:4-aminobutyrate aminotransferase / (S)-3-amino-2-methylpropionate transaminase / 5-aminovalerate transaminase